MPLSHFPLVSGQFPQIRLRRNRTQGWSRNLMAENQLTAHDLIWPVFVREEGIAADFKTMPDIKRLSIPELLKEMGRLVPLGLQSVLLFPVIAQEKRDEAASQAFDEEGVLCQAVRALKAAYPDVGIITDVALDPYTSHGQDGLVIKGKIDNDETLKALERHALVQARAGADVIGPSEMMDGRVGVIRRALDAGGFQDVGIMSYAAKYASCLYGPFREALGSNVCLGKADKKTYQLDPANLDEALREVAMDLQEGADSIIIKPGVPYLDVVRRVKDTFKVPTVTFHVSAEYAMLYHAAQAGVFKFDDALLETLLCCKRAGADGIITYGTPRVLELLAEQRMQKSA
jgi:porphobilinogen synthase